MARLLSMLGVVVSFGFIAAGAIMNWRYGLGIGRSVEDQQLNAGVHLLIDLCKVMMPFFMWWAWRSRRVVVAAGAALVTVAAISYSAVGIAGFVNLSWSLTSGILVGKQDQAVEWRAELERTRQRLDALGVTQAPTVIERELERLQQDARWSSSTSCTQATLAASRNFCADYKRLEEDKAKADTAAELEARVASLRGKLTALSGVAGLATSAGGDPRADIVARVTGWRLSYVQTLLALLFVGIVEFMATFGAFLSLNHGELTRTWQDEQPDRGMSRPVAAGRALAGPVATGLRPESQAVEEIVMFIAEATEPTKGGIEIADLHVHYAAWCERAGVAALDVRAFERAFDQLRSIPEVGKRISKFRSRYIGIGIAAAARRQEGRR